ncbi:MAG: hypothetical protein J6K16_07435 [Alphaproteobacteria bacterium]|nr:hypothetical protein [Alphaproteobacteria bacterium]
MWNKLTFLLVEMKKFILYLTVFSAIFVGKEVVASDMDTMLFGPAKKITAAPEKNDPLIPRIVKETPENKDAAIPLIKKKGDKEEVFVPKEEHSPLTVGSSVSPTKKDKSLTDEIKELDKEERGLEEEDEDEDVKEELFSSADDDDFEEEDDDSEEESLLKGTWVEKLGASISKDSKKDEEKAEDNSSSDKVSLEGLTKSSKKSGRSNASVFDISGVMLRMSLEQAQSTLLKRGYKMVSQKFEIPNFIKWRYEEQCRNAGIVGYERLNNCVVKAAKASNHQYVESARFMKYDSQEEVNFWLTSNFTNNKVYKITYSTGITNVNRGSGQKIQYLRNIKTFEFWRRINQKYGTPDNKTEVLWGLGGNKPYMKASTGKLMLEDPMLRELDYTRMSREDAKFMNTNLYNF